MAYGKNSERKDWLMRATPLGIGEISTAKLSSLLDLRGQVLDLMRKMAKVGFNQEPLGGTDSRKELDAQLLEVQKDSEGLNSVWREQARMRVKPVLEEASKRYFRKLIGRLRHVDNEVEYREDRGTRPLYINIPQEIEQIVTSSEIQALKRLTASGKAIAAFRAVVLKQDTQAFVPSPNQTAILKHIHSLVQEKHRPPMFGMNDEFTLQLHIDSRMLPTGQSAEAMSMLAGVSYLLADEENKRYCRFLDISGAWPRSARIRIPLSLTQKIAQRLTSTSQEWASLILEISSRNVGVRLVTGKPQPAQPVVAQRILGRDYGFANTISGAILESATEINLEDLQSSLKALDSGDKVRDYVEAHLLPDAVNVVARYRFSGRPFLDRVKVLCEEIDGYKSRIDRQYNSIGKLRKELLLELNLKPAARLHPEHKKENPKVRLFFGELGLARDLKKAQRNCYKKIARIKKCWFGYLSNVETSLALKHGAAILREDLTVEAIEKDSPEYKGRVFNKMINNGSKGQYQRMASDKFLWNGIPEIVAPSWYTSRTCLKHSSIVDKKLRIGEDIFFPCCGVHDHADEHAAETIAGLAFLVPKVNGDVSFAPVRDTSYPALVVGSLGL